MLHNSVAFGERHLILALWAQINFSTKYQRWYLVEKSLILKRWSTKKSTSQPQFNQKSTNCQPNFKHFSTLTFQLQTWLIFGWIVVVKLIFGCNCFKINDFSTKYQRWGWLRKVEVQRRINVDSTLRSWSVSTGGVTHFLGVGMCLSEFHK